MDHSLESTEEMSVLLRRLKNQTKWSFLFLFPYFASLLVIFGVINNQVWAFKGVFWLGLAVAALDILVGIDASFPLNIQDTEPSQSRAWQFTLWLWVPAQAVIVLCGLLTVTQEALTVRNLYLVTASIGVTNGIFCVPVAHELMHRKNRFEQALAEFLMTMVSYPHFCIEHVHGHHRNVGTDRDPATARFGESFYSFYQRSVFGGVISAWKLETNRLRQHRGAILSYHNRMLRYLTSLVLLYATIHYTCGWVGIIFFASQGIIAFSTLEMINYIQHYGLTRYEITPGHYERVMPWHSWNSNHRISNWLLVNLPRHADHHFQTARNYYLLRHAGDAPQLPNGYFGIFLLPLFPPLWRYIMDPRVEVWRRTHGFYTDLIDERRSCDRTTGSSEPQSRSNLS